MITNIKQAAGEPSSWAGAAAIVQGLSFFVPQYKAVFDALVMLAGALAVVMRERGHKAGA